MQYIDTNVLARILLQDDPVQGRRADRFVDAAAERGESLLVTDVVLAELFWMLKQKSVPREMVLTMMIRLLDNGSFQFDDHERTAMAVGLWAEHNVDFADAYLAARCGREGEGEVISFDSDFKRLPVHWVQP
jgi:predicted nucleic-acid-binding protein